MMRIGQPPGERSRASKYDPAFCDRIIEMAGKGLLPEQWAAELNIAMSTLYLWANVYPEFEEAVLIAYPKAAAIWLDNGMSNIKNPDFRTSIWVEVMRKRFPALYQREAYTEEHFRDRDRGATDGKPLLDPEEMKHAPDTVINDAIAKMEERRRILKEG